MRAIAFVDDLLEVSEGLVGGLLDGALDILLRHLFGTGLGQKGAEAGVAGHVRSAVLDGDGDLLAKLGEDAGHVAPALHLPFLAEFKRSSHGTDYLYSILEMYLSMS